MKLVRTLRGHSDIVGRIAWSPDGQTLASPSFDKTIRLWDVETGECRSTIGGRQGGVMAGAFDPAGTRRWVVERTFAWLNQFRRLRLRYERRADIHEVFRAIGCALVCWRFLDSRSGYLLDERIA